MKAYRKCVIIVAVLSWMVAWMNPAQAQAQAQPPASVFVNGEVPNHVQGIAYDAEKDCFYLSFTTRFLKTDRQGNILASIDRIQGHLGAMTFDPVTRRVYESLECKDDVIGAGIAKNLQVENVKAGESVFYVAIIDVDKVTRIGMDPEKDADVLKTVCINDAVRDYHAKVTVDGKEYEHRLGCSGIDGVAIGPQPGGKGRYLYVAYGIYGDVNRPDNDYQVILRYNLKKLDRKARGVVFGENHYSGPKPADIYYVYTGNTNWGVQNMAYDPHTGYLFMAVYKGKKPAYPNYALFAADLSQPARKAALKGVPYIGKGKQIPLAEAGLTDESTGIRGWRFKWGATGICPLGDGRWYFSENGSDKKTKIQNSTLRLYRWTGDPEHPFASGGGTLAGATFPQVPRSDGEGTAAGKTVRFAFITDNHYSVGSKAGADLTACIDDINSLPDIDFVVMGGDITDFGADAELRDVKALFDRLKYPYYVVAGNHDAKWSESGCNTHKATFGYEHFEFDCKGWRFIGCNSGPDMRMAPALIPREAMVWLEGLQPGRKTVFFNHFPQDSSVLNYFDVTRELKRIGTRFEVGGHWHRNVKMDYDGLPAILGRSALSAGKEPGYNLITLDGNHVSVCERRIRDGKAEQLEPWYEKDLKPVKDTVTYDAAGLPASYPWMRYDVNTAFPQVKEVWKVREQANIVAGFARDDTRAWYTTASGQVCCIRLSDGGKLWTRQFPGKIFSTPALGDGLVVFGCTDGGIYAVDAESGSTRWTACAGKSVLGSPVIFDGNVFVGASDGTFRCLQLKDGTAVWTFDGVEGFVECRAWVDAQQVVFGTWENRLYSLDTRTGALQWIWKCAKPSRMYSPAATWPVKADGKIFISVPDRCLYVLDARTGEQVAVQPACAREAIGLSEDGRTVYTKSMWHRLFAWNAADASAKWAVETSAGYEISPTALVEKDGVVLMPTDKGNLLAFSASDGSLLWKHKLSIAMINPLQAWTEQGSLQILASTMDGTITLLTISL